MRKSKLLPKRVEMEFRGGLEEEVTAHAGVVLLIETGRRGGVIETADRVLGSKKKLKGLGRGQMVESFVIPSALGGGCVDDFQALRSDLGLKAMLGYELPAPSTARSFLELFHDERALAQRPAQGSFIPRETAGLEGPRGLVRGSARAYVSAAKPGRDLTMDVDAHLVESSKREARMTHEGFRGYQALVVTWAETNLVLADQFRDGNVPPGQGIAELVDEAYDSLPAHPERWRVAVRSDSAAYDVDVLDHWQSRGWKFAVSADMSRRGPSGAPRPRSVHAAAPLAAGEDREAGAAAATGRSLVDWLKPTSATSFPTCPLREGVACPVRRSRAPPWRQSFARHP